jgi:hypothetical protein
VGMWGGQSTLAGTHHQRFHKKSMVRSCINLLLYNINYANNNTFKLSMKRLSYYILPINFNSVFTPPPQADEFHLSQINRRLPSSSV